MTTPSDWNTQEMVTQFSPPQVREDLDDHRWLSSYYISTRGKDTSELNWIQLLALRLLNL